MFWSGKQGKTDQRIMIKFMTVQNMRPIDIWWRLRHVHGTQTLCQVSVRNWVRKFEANPQLSCLDKAHPGCPRFAQTQRKINSVRRFLGEDARHSIREIAVLCGISVGTAHRIVTKELKLHKIASRFVPKILTDDQKQRRLQAARNNLQRLVDKPLLLRNIVTGDESWVHCYELNVKQRDMVWIGPQEQRPMKALHGRSTKKVMLTTFFDDTACVHHKYTQKSVNRYTYTRILAHLHEKLRRKRPSMWHQGFGRERAVILLHDNATPHRALHTRAHLRATGVTTLEHPPYSPDMSPCDYFLFPCLKKELRGRRFANVDALKDKVDRVLREIPIPRSDPRPPQVLASVCRAARWLL